MGPQLDTKLSVKYMVEGDENERRRKKRQEAFAVQVKRGVNKMHVRLQAKLLASI